MKNSFSLVLLFSGFVLSTFLLTPGRSAFNLPVFDSGKPGQRIFQTDQQQDLKISLAQWSLQRTFIGDTITDWGPWIQKLRSSPKAALKGQADPMDFPVMAREFGIDRIELLNIFYFDKARDTTYWHAFKKNCDDAGVTVGLIMCDILGNLADPDSIARMQAVKNHYPWVDAAAFLGAESIRVNVSGDGDPVRIASYAREGLISLARYAAPKGINILVENQRGISADGAWLGRLLDDIEMDNVGALPDFGNFCLERGPEGCLKDYDRYRGVEQMMPYAKGVSAKSYAFDENGNESEIDFLRMMKIVKDAGFKGYIGIEYDGKQLSEGEGIKATKALLERVFKEI